MKKFLAIYIGLPNSEAGKKWDALDEKTRNEKVKAGIDAWGSWGAKNALAIIEHGGPLGKTKRAGSSGISDIKNSMTAFAIVQAESHQAAAKLFENHPHFSIFPGDSVEIMEWLPTPGM